MKRLISIFAAMPLVCRHGHVLLGVAVFLLAAACRLSAQEAVLTNSLSEVSSSASVGIAWVGRQPPTAEEEEQARAVRGDKEGMEQFITAHPGSSWTPGIRQALALGYRHAGRHTLSLNLWDSIWKQCRESTNSAAQQLAHQALAGQVELLSSLGRVDQLYSLLKAAEGRMVSDHNDRRRIAIAREAYVMMADHPRLSYRCGSLALAAIARQRGKSPSDIAPLIEEPSTTNGISLARLVQLAGERGLGLVAVQRMDATPVPLPAVVHWSQNHYGALVDYLAD